MPLFDRYIAVDWSAENKAKSGKDSIWIGTSEIGSLPTSENPRTRHAAMAELRTRCLAAIAAGERLLIGFDFAFGYPAGAAETIGGTSSWQSIWTRLAVDVVDGSDNVSNRFHAAERINRSLADGLARYWGHPWQHRYDALTRHKPADNHRVIAEKRLVERYNSKTQPVWKLSGIGAVGSQAFVGIPRLQALRADPLLAGHVAIWPFETAFANDLSKSITVAEIFPSIINVVAGKGEVRDRLQVEAISTLFARADQAGKLKELLSAPASLASDDLPVVLAEEGWIVGVGHEALVTALSRQAA